MTKMGSVTKPTLISHGLWRVDPIKLNRVCDRVCQDLSFIFSSIRTGLNPGQPDPRTTRPVPFLFIYGGFSCVRNLGFCWGYFGGFGKREELIKEGRTFLDLCKLINLRMV